MVELRSTYPQMSDWSTGQNSISHNPSASNINRQTKKNSNSIQHLDHVTDNKSTNNDKQKNRSLLKFYRCCSSIPPNILGLFLGLLFGSVVLTVIIPLWLASTNTTTSTTTTVDTMPDTTINTTTTMSSVLNFMASNSCNVSNNTVLYYHTNPTTYTLETYNYTASSNGIATLSFSFYTITGTFYWHLDDISVIDTSASNSEMLTNGNFESGTLIGWQQLCIQNCSSSPGNITTATCHGGVYCYKDACRYGSDILQQAFPVISGHLYTLSFWLRSDGGPVQQAFVSLY